MKSTTALLLIAAVALVISNADAARKKRGGWKKRPDRCAKLSYAKCMSNKACAYKNSKCATFSCYRSLKSQAACSGNAKCEWKKMNMRGKVMSICINKGSKMGGKKGGRGGRGGKKGGKRACRDRSKQCAKIAKGNACMMGATMRGRKIAAKQIQRYCAKTCHHCTGGSTGGGHKKITGSGSCGSNAACTACVFGADHGKCNTELQRCSVNRACAKTAVCLGFGQGSWALKFKTMSAVRTTCRSNNPLATALLACVSHCVPEGHGKGGGKCLDKWGSTCPVLAKMGDCKSGSLVASMKVNCAKTCKICGDKDMTGHKMTCKDQHPDMCRDTPKAQCSNAIVRQLCAKRCGCK